MSLYTIIMISYVVKLSRAKEKTFGVEALNAAARRRHCILNSHI